MKTGAQLHAPCRRFLMRRTRSVHAALLLGTWHTWHSTPK
eukprot:CAMPEP_0177345784 /NCGR_PEP_ID=MMETSP0368-20130122/28830_1 /TAXON_ID=447022 ORGANISM="Scrippsiella hangoei-like, Strain SHHI-4" /NCGR_SAMPLE_ID=MMETSP0368 /ASSEMBLY_ACC=CAM_ASM_000363 /LENGTH=39 /DNA_ID= /DNA_START= /DNA_END= /DNA_ORIENTATION=